MTLTTEQLRAVTCGAAEVIEAGGEVGFHRFTTAQSDCYRAKRNPDFYNKTFGTAGVRLAFTTDSKSLAFDYRMENRGSSRKFAFIDVTVNGVLCGHFGDTAGDIAGRIAGHAQMPLEGFSIGETKLVEVYLPWSKAAWLKNVSLDDGATLAPAKREKVMISYGDSITHGYDAIYPSMSYASQLARLCGADSYNRAIGGDTFFPELLDLEEVCTPDIVTVAYGTNDWSHHNPVHYAKECGAFYRKLAVKFPMAQIYAITPIWRGDYAKKTPFGAPAYETEALIRRCCQSLTNVRVIPGWNLVPHHEGFMSDGHLHPNDLGFCEYARNLYAAMTE